MDADLRDRPADDLDAEAPVAPVVEPRAVLDALGRVITRHDGVSRDLRLDVSAFAPGVYAVRVATGAQTVTHRLTVVR